MQTCQRGIVTASPRQRTVLAQGALSGTARHDPAMRQLRPRDFRETRVFLFTVGSST
jgi:hypothetical protein